MGPRTTALRSSSGPRANAAHQAFLIEPVGASYRIMATHSGKVLDVTAVSGENSARIQQWTCVGGDNQLWEFTPIRPDRWS